jgi:hypothetical protein
MVLAGDLPTLPTILQGTGIPIISDAQCANLWPNSFDASNMICVWGGVGGGIGSCNVSCFFPKYCHTTTGGWLALQDFPSILFEIVISV